MFTLTKVLASSAALALLALALWSCGPDPSHGPLDRMAAGKPTPALHAVHSEQLQNLMTELGQASAEDWPQEMADLRSDQDEQARFRKAHQLARALAISAKQIPQAIADVPMAEAKRAAFLAGADELEQKAAQLEATAAAQDLRRMQSALSKIKMTCCGCHAQFCEKDIPLEFGR